MEKLDIVRYMASDARAFSLGRPVETALELFTDNPVFERLVEDICAEGVNLPGCPRDAAYKKKEHRSLS